MAGNEAEKAMSNLSLEEEHSKPKAQEQKAPNKKNSNAQPTPAKFKPYDPASAPVLSTGLPPEIWELVQSAPASFTPQYFLDVSRNLLERPEEQSLRGLFHMTGTGFANWAEFATEVFALSVRFGGPSAKVRSIATSDYPTPAKRPANSRLDCSKLAEVHGVGLKNLHQLVLERLHPVEGS